MTQRTRLMLWETMIQVLPILLLLHTEDPIHLNGAEISITKMFC